ncbi:hypothetical protein GUJ93_ZPchr0001g30677 [Zizania palustris]|uniref:Uncharacterized protein n=1 Tax=Zizania palustris TaxID=103762 RepID=A0A8J5V9Q9_ZIZPA|nr:hypothetical protein GUJ93_ZPchr0001g30677 [Zizania palustris]
MGTALLAGNARSSVSSASSLLPLETTADANLSKVACEATRPAAWSTVNVLTHLCNSAAPNPYFISNTLIPLDCREG